MSFASCGAKYDQPESDIWLKTKDRLLGLGLYYNSSTEWRIGRDDCCNNNTMWIHRVPVV